jgi:hypothetical protein
MRWQEECPIRTQFLARIPLTLDPHTIEFGPADKLFHERDLLKRLRVP